MTMDSKTSECNKDAHTETVVVLSNDNQLSSNLFSYTVTESLLLSNTKAMCHPFAVPLLISTYIILYKKPLNIGEKSIHLVYDTVLIYALSYSS